MTKARGLDSMRRVLLPGEKYDEDGYMGETDRAEIAAMDELTREETIDKRLSEFEAAQETRQIWARNSQTQPRDPRQVCVGADAAAVRRRNPPRNRGEPVRDIMDAGAVENYVAEDVARIAPKQLAAIAREVDLTETQVSDLMCVQYRRTAVLTKNGLTELHGILADVRHLFVTCRHDDQQPVQTLSIKKDPRWHRLVVAVYMRNVRPMLLARNLDAHEAPHDWPTIQASELTNWVSEVFNDVFVTMYQTGSAGLRRHLDGGDYAWTVELGTVDDNGSVVQAEGGGIRYICDDLTITQEPGMITVHPSFVLHEAVDVQQGRRAVLGGFVNLHPGGRNQDLRTNGGWYTTAGADLMTDAQFLARFCKKNVQRTGSTTAASEGAMCVARAG